VQANLFDEFKLKLPGKYKKSFTARPDTIQYNLLEQATNVHARNTFVNVTVVCGK